MFKADKSFDDSRRRMISVIQNKYDLKSPEILSAMLQIPRHKFVDRKYWSESYLDKPISIGFSQTMSQPYTVAYMTHLLTEKLESFDKVLELGTGSGYQAAVLSKLFKKVYTMEIIPELAQGTKKTLKRLGYKNVFVKSASGEWGWKEKSPFDAILVTAGMEKIPNVLFDQLKINGVLVAPLGKGIDKRMTRLKKDRKNGKGKLVREEFGIFHFVPFVER